MAAEPAVIGEAVGIWAAHGAGSQATLLLPTTAGRPRLSPLVGPWSTRTARSRPSPSARLTPWRVPTLALGVEDAIKVLPTLAGRPRPADGLAVGPSVHGLARAVDLALHLAARGRFLPGIVRDEDGRPCARWLAAPDPDATERIAQLARSLPPACRAEWRETAPDGRDPGDVVAELAGAVIDHVARIALRGQVPIPATTSRRHGSVPPSDAFLSALMAEDPHLAGDETEVATLAQALSEWHASGIRQTGPVRTTFRVVAPPDGPGPDPAIRDTVGGGPLPDPWRIEFLLQSREDPSLLVPAERIWRTRDRVAVLGGLVEHPRERLLTDLGHASRLYPELEGALETAHPTALTTDASGAHRFLSEAAPLLEGAGFGVLVPPWWRSRAARLGVRVHARPSKSAAAVPGTGLLGLEGLVDYRYEVALGEDVLDAAELRQLAELKVPLVRVKGAWVELRTDEIDAALRALERGAGGAQATAGDVLREALGLGPAAPDLPVLEVTGEGWLGELLAVDQRLEPMVAPHGFRGSLRPYQERGLAWLAFLERIGLGGILADDMGLGKTVQVLALLLTGRDAPDGRGRTRRTASTRPGPTLLVCPMSVVGNWQREAERFAPSLRAYVHHGGERLTGRTFARTARSSDLVITTYGLVVRDAEALAGVRWRRIVVDEAQSIKNAETRQSRAVRSLPATSRLALTGTPVENRLAELWSIMEFCDPGLLGSARAFRERFAVPVERYGDEEAAARLKRVIGPFVLRRLKTDRSIIADLPDKLEMKVFCNLTREQAALYQAVVDDMLARIEASEGIERRGLVLATMTKLKQVCNHPAHLLADGSRLDGRSGKLARLDEILEEALAEGDRALCFTQFAEMGHLLRDHLQHTLGVEVPFLHGGVAKPARDAMVARFAAADGPPVLLLSLKAGGVGLNLTAANHVIHFDRWWNPAVEDQATDRAFRIGQRRDVQVRKFVCVGTLEERIDRMIEDKRALAERIVGTGEAWLTELSTDRIRELVALTADAVAEA